MRMRIPARSEMSGLRATYVCMVFSRARWSSISSKPFAVQRIHLRRLLERRHVAALLEDLEAGFRNAAGELLEPRDGHDPIVAPRDHQRGATERAEERQAVDPPDDLPLLAQERLLADRERH